MLGGEVVAALVWRSGLVASLPPGIRAVPGPVVVLAQRWESSPVGPYRTLAVGHPARSAAHVGVCFTTVVVSSQDARAAGRSHWGLPAECGALRWSDEPGGVGVVWDERGIVLRARFGRRRVPLAVPVPLIQARGAPVVAATRLRGRAARARVELVVPVGDVLAPLAGRRRGAHVAGVETVLHAAAEPLALRARLRAPERGVEPGLP